jgi:hypothetical protein
MNLTEGFETSVNINKTQGNHPKVDILNTEHGKSLKSRSIKSWLRGNVTGMFGTLSVFGRHIKGMIRLRLEQVWTYNVTSPPSAPLVFLVLVCVLVVLYVKPFFF